jgi:hypothetical protein
MQAHHWLALIGGSSSLPALVAALPFCLMTLLGGSAAAAPATAAALELIKVTPGEARSKLLQAFSVDARSDWSYVPRRRAGIAWRDLNTAQREQTTALLRTALSDSGLDKVRAVMALEIALRELETFGPSRDPENYAIAIFGTPGAAPARWGWRLEGHHLSLHFTLDGDRYIATLPQFFGANPALVPHDIGGGPRKGTRVLGKEEDFARQLMAGLSEPLRRAALFDDHPYGDIVTKSAAKLDPLAPVGVQFTDLPAAQQASLLKLITVFAEHLRPELVEARLARVRSGGLDSIRFGWAGSLEPGEPHYYRIQGKVFLIELDNSGGNHIHSVWRDFTGDWGRDILREHYTGSSAPEHPHGQR